MLRRLAAVLAGLLVAGTLAVSSATPASAHTEVCAGTGVALVGSPGLTYAVITPPSPSLSFSASLTVGACVTATPAVTTSLSATGSVSGNCGLSAGAGVTATGHAFVFVGVGTFLVITGGVTGTGQVTADVTAGSSCLTGATRFLVQAGVVAG